MDENDPSSNTQTCPSILILLSHDHLEWPKIIKGIMSTVNLAEDQTHKLPFKAKFATTWHLQNKYYYVSVQLVVMLGDVLSNHSLVQSKAEAVIIYWDNTLNDSRQKLDDILMSLEQLRPEVCLLVCDSFTEDVKVSRYEANQWCIENGWELIELEQQPASDCDDDSLEDDFLESSGFQRVQGALHANCWSTMKQTAGSVPLSSKTLLTREEDPFVGHEEPHNESDDEPEVLQNVDDDENFEDLFARFGQMRLTAASLSREDRLDYAERVATAFLGALGGDEDESDAEGKNIPDAEDGDDVHEYSELINIIDNVKLDNESASHTGVSSDDVTENGENDARCKEFGSTELLTDLGFPVVKSETPDRSSEGSLNISASYTMEDTSKPDSSFSVDEHEEEFTLRSYEDIENELKQEKLTEFLQKAAAADEIRNELQVNIEQAKKFRM